MSILDSLELRLTLWQRRAAAIRKDLDQLDQERYIDTPDLVGLRERELQQAEKQIELLNQMIGGAKALEANSNAS